jgi:hypothetical protein
MIVATCGDRHARLAGMPVDSLNVSLGLPFGLGNIGGTWKPKDDERKAAWEMYVELITRVSVAELGDDEGLVREALTSLHSVFGTTRDILRKYGPDVAQPAKDADVSFGRLSVGLLNGCLRPFLSKWHPRLADHESRRPPEVTAVEWERQWAEAAQARTELAAVRQVATRYAEILGEVCDAPDLLHAVDRDAAPI